MKFLTMILLALPAAVLAQPAPPAEPVPAPPSVEPVDPAACKAAAGDLAELCERCSWRCQIVPKEFEGQCLEKLFGDIRKHTDQCNKGRPGQYCQDAAVFENCGPVFDDDNQGGQ